MAEPGHSRKEEKYSDLEGGDATEGGVEGMAEPGHSRKGGNHSDLEGGMRAGMPQIAGWRG